MRIIDIQERTVSIASNIRNAYIDFSKMNVSLVALLTDVVIDGQRVIGYGFNSNGRYAQGCILRERLIPRILEASPESLLDDSGHNFDPHRVWNVMMTNEKPGGHGERSVAVGVIDMAVWDVVAKLEQKPLYRVLAERYNGGFADEKVFVYAAGGYYYPGKDIEQLKDEIRSYLAMGYSVVKIKIGGESLKEDLKRIEAVLEVVASGEHLAVDANGRFDLDTALAYAAALEPYGLRWYEEAGDPLDYALQAKLSQQYQLPMATGENLFSMQDARNLLRYGGMRSDRDILQMDPVLSYGLVEYLRFCLKTHLHPARVEAWETDTNSTKANGN
jgi:L-alanine-DL-glutamate epimerase-like enolase superfamily enzyme